MIVPAILTLWLATTAPQEDPRLAEAMKQYEAGETEPAVQRLRSICEAPGGEEQAWLDMARFLVTRRDWKASLPFAERAYALMPENANTHLTLGNCYLYLNQSEKAAEVFADSVRRFPEQAAIHYNYGLALARSQKLSEAEGHYQEALRLQPDNAMILCTMGQHQVLLLRHEEALKYLGRAAEVEPPHPDARWRLARVLADLGRDEEARETFLAALDGARGSSRMEGQYHFGVFLFERARFEPALKRLDLALKLKPKHRMAHQYRARCLRALGRLDEAREAAATYRELQREEDRVDEDFLLSLLVEQLGLEKQATDDEPEPPPKKDDGSS